MIRLIIAVLLFNINQCNAETFETFCHFDTLLNKLMCNTTKITNVTINPEICKVFISELNPDNPIKPETREFIELTQDCCDSVVPSKSLNGYKIVLVEYSGIKNQPVITLVVDLSQQNFDSNDFFVIGGKDINVAQLKVPDPRIQFRNKFASKQTSDFLTNGNNYPIGLLLLYSETNIPFEINENIQEIYVSHWINELKKWTVDMVVYGRRAHANRCDFFEQIYPKFVNMRYTKRDYDTGKQDHSINRCTASIESFLPQYLKLGNPTPGAINDCSGPDFIFETIMHKITQTVISVPINENINECISDIEPQHYESMETSLIQEELEEQMDLASQEPCTSTFVPRDTNTDLSQISVDSERVENLGYTLEKEWENFSHFNESWLDEMDPNKMPIDYIRENAYNIKTWFEYIPDQTNPRMKCWICSTYADKFRMGRRYRSPITSDNGVEISDDKDINRDLLRFHFKKVLHSTIITRLVKQKDTQIPNDYIDIQQQIDISAATFKATNNMFRTVYTMIISNIPFSSIDKLINLQELHGVELGSIYHNRFGALDMSKTIVKVMKQKLLTHLKTSQYPISLLLDSSDAGLHYLSVMFQTIENDRTVVYFYALIELTSDETGLGLYNSLYQQLEKDDLIEFMERNLFGVATDGALNFKSPSKGVVAYLQNNLAKRPIFKIHCLAHRLQLALHHATAHAPYFDDFERIINDNYKFFQTKGHKRLNELRKVAEDTDEKIFKLNYIYKIRWVLSELSAIKKVKSMWKTIVITLQVISENKHEFPDQKTRNEAFQLMQKMKDKRFVIILHFLIDVLQDLSTYSLYFQESDGLIIGKTFLINKLINSVKLMQTTNGDIVNTFLNEALCNGVKCTYENYDKSIVFWNEIQLVDTTLVTSLSLFRRQVLNNLEAEINTYFPDIIYSSFDVFSPSNLPRSVPAMETYGQEQIKTIAEFFKLDIESIKTDWPVFLKTIFADQVVWCQSQDQSPHIFYANILKIPNLPVSVTGLIRIVLTLPIGSANVERSFSIMNHIRTSRRHRFTSETLNNLLFVRSNGPKNVKKFDSMSCAKYWYDVERKSLVDDPMGVVQKKQHDYDDKENSLYFQESALF